MTTVIHPFGRATGLRIRHIGLLQRDLPPPHVRQHRDVRRRRHLPSARHADGQALVECLVLCGALLMFFLAAPLLAKYQDMRRASVAASRTVAFECTVRLDDCRQPAAAAELVEQARRRHFTAHGRSILSNDGLPSSTPGAEYQEWWRDRHGRPLLARYGDVAGQLRTEGSDAVDSGVKAIKRALTALSDVAGPGAFGLEIDEGLITARMQAKVSLNQRLAHWLEKPEGLALALNGQTALMTDPWNAVSARGEHPRTFESRVDRGRRLPGRLTTGSGDEISVTEAGFDIGYAPVRLLMGNYVWNPLEPLGLKFKYHEIDVEVVPQDRLGNKVTR